ncbi:MAG: glutamate 5-kinase, partial [Nitrospirales bacterium]
MHQQLITGAKRVVLKIGSSLVASRDFGLRHDLIARLSRDIAELNTPQREIVIVSSGAIVAGIEKLGLKNYPQSIPLKQAAAAAGQSHLIHAYEKCFQEAGQKVAQVLLTHQDLADRKRFLNARHTLT